MSLKLSSEPVHDFVEYNKFFKRWYGILLIVIICMIAAILISYFSFIRNLQLFHGTLIASILLHIKREIFSYSALGIFYIYLFGGMFFIFVPVETFYIAVLNKGTVSSLHLLMLFFGVLVSYSLNYIIGLRLSRFSKNLISPKKFYNTKILVNRFGKWAILFFNLIGLGSQQLTFVLGVFRYNKTRLLVFTAIGQVLKFVLITLFMFGFFG
jgi:membrane protein YqaA with SNARE-associated domain